MIDLILKLPPSGNHRNGFNRKTGRHYRLNKTQAYYDEIAELRLEIGARTFLKPLEADIMIFCTDSRRDADNILKTLYDALQYGQFVQDDKLITKVTYEIFYNRSKINHIKLKMWER